MRTLFCYYVIGVIFATGSLAYEHDESQRDIGSTVRKSPSDLRRKLFRNYDKNVRPVKEYTDVVTTRIGLAPLFIREVDEEREILVMDAWITLVWNDKYLTWDPKEHDGLKFLNVPSTELWKPDIITHTASPDKRLLPQIFTNVNVNSTGGVSWVPPLTISTSCPLDLTNYPYDVQRCVIKLGSWTFGKSAVDLQPHSPVFSLDYFVDNNPKWNLIGATAQKVDNYYPCCPDESYPSINFNMTLRRKLSAPVQIAQNLSYFACFLAMLMFWLPPDSIYKVLLGAIADLYLGLTVLYVVTVIPAPMACLKAASRIYPLMCAVSAALLVEVLVMNIARVMGPCRPPKFFIYLAKGCCTMFCVCISRPYPGGDLQNDAESKSESGKKTHRNMSAQEEWNLVAMAIDRMLFLIAVMVSIFFYKLW